MKVNITITKEEATKLQWVLDWYQKNCIKIDNHICSTGDLDLYEIIERVLNKSTIVDEQDYSDSEKEYQEIKKKVEGD